MYRVTWSLQKQITIYHTKLKHVLITMLNKYIKLLKGRFFRCFFQKSTYHQNGLNVFKYTVMYMFFFSDKVWYENYFSLSPAFMFKCFTTSTVVTTICRYITQSLFYKYFDARVHKHFCYNQSDSHVSFIFS